jgi:hypothetical protein
MGTSKGAAMTTTRSPDRVDLLGYLDAHFQTNGVFYDDYKSGTRVEFDDTDTVVYRFVRGMLTWKARFTDGTPVDVIVATIEAP